MEISQMGKKTFRQLLEHHFFNQKPKEISKGTKSPKSLKNTFFLLVIIECF
jgi:hypothetical protein